MQRKKKKEGESPQREKIKRGEEEEMAFVPNIQVIYLFYFFNVFSFILRYIF
jgi:hypothetical protein